MGLRTTCYGQPMEAIDDSVPDGVILDVRLGEYRDDQFKGLDLLKRIVAERPRLPVLMFTQYSQGVGAGHRRPQRAAGGSAR